MSTTKTSTATDVDVTGETCPKPLVEARKAFNALDPGDEVTIVGDHRPSKKEIPMAVEALGLELVSIEEGEDESWAITVRMPKG